MKPLSGMDASFLYMETPSQLVQRRGRADPRPVRRRRVLVRPRRPHHPDAHCTCFAPFRRRLVPVPFDLGHPVWIEDPDFDLEAHIHRGAVRSPGTMRELAEVVADIASTPARPEPSAVGAAPPRRSRERQRRPRHEDPPLDHRRRHGRRPDGEPLRSDTRCARPGAAGRTVATRARPVRPRALGVLDAAHRSAAERDGEGRRQRGAVRGRHRATTTRGKRAKIARRRRCRSWHRRCGGPRPSRPHRSVAFGKASLDDMRHIKTTFGTTVNDVVLAACTQTLRQYLIAHDDLPDMPLVCSVPVSVHGRSEHEGTNQVSTMFVRLPVQLPDPVEQLGVDQRRDPRSERSSRTRSAPTRSRTSRNSCRPRCSTAPCAGTRA